MGKVLIVIDMQNDFVTGTLGNKEAQAIVLNVQAKESKVCGPRGSDNFYQGYPWGELSGHAGGEKAEKKVTSEALHQWNGRLADCAWAGSGKLRICTKPTFGWLNWEGFGSNDEIELVGVCTDICVVSNALILKAKYPEAIISVDASCCAGVTPEKHNAALETMKSCQIDVYGQEE